MDLVLGVDGGNSKAVALVARRDGSIIGAARRPGSADIYAGEAAALELLRSVVADALADAGASRSDVAAAAFSLAGADWPEDIAFLQSSLGRVGVCESVIVVNDAIGALAGAVPEGLAVVVSVGTGAATGARAVDGSTWHSSFWQVTHGAAELADRTVASVAHHDLGIEAAPLLLELVLAATGDDSAETALHRMTRRERGASEAVGAVVRALFQAADAGDAVAARIVVRHGTGIGEVAAAAARRMGIDREPYALAFCGGVARAGASRLIAAALDAIAAAGQSPQLTAPRWEPAVGALLIGLRSSAGADAWSMIHARLDATMPAAGLFDPGA
ncbi:MAG: BadF/BadG/BcrA/BcrD ATPase family protein [Candidatus Limnocylindria bacterium]